jgi:ABC-type multidrug transport system fused ATPase/permease subunit
LHTLLRLLDIKLGTIHINGFDLESLPRELVQSRVIAIPQDPFILSDTVRRNIDPFELVSDELIINENSATLSGSATTFLFSESYVEEGGDLDPG